MGITLQLGSRKRAGDRENVHSGSVAEDGRVAQAGAPSGGAERGGAV
jgi:hypothetical protein